MGVLAGLTATALFALYAFGLQDAGAEYDVVVHALAIDDGVDAEFSTAVPGEALRA